MGGLNNYVRNMYRWKQNYFWVPYTQFLSKYKGPHTPPPFLK